MADARDRLAPETVVVTGLGAVSGLGWGVAALWDGLRAGRSAIAGFDVFDHARHRTHVAAQVPPGPRIEGALTRADGFAIAAAVEAAAQAGLGASDLKAAGVFFGSSTGGVLESEGFLADLLAGRRRLDLHRVAAQEMNGPGDAVARRLGTGGPLETTSSACTSGSQALVVAADALRRGEIGLAIAGGADSLCQLTYAGFNSLRAVDERPSRPFRADRRGLSLGEGAAVLLLETLAHAHARGARPLAVLAGAAATCDAHHMSAPAPGGEGAVRAIRLALAAARMPATAIDFVNAHGTGTELNDAAEAAAVVAVFGERARSLPLTSTKAIVGHLLGASGALEAVATVLSLRHELVHATPGEGEADPALGIDLVRAPRPLPGARAALSINLAFGGTNTALVFTGLET
jgi:3-oxoacyl-[acyl-carrier-protein] synthase II